MSLDELLLKRQRSAEIEFSTRRRRLRTPLREARTEIDEQTCINFCSNDYLGLSQHPNLQAAFIEGIQQYGVGSGASPLVSGYTKAHQDLEARLAEFLERDKVVLYSSGYAANVGTISALISRSDHVYLDRLCHASLIDGVKLSGAKIRRYQHVDYPTLASKLAEECDQEKWVISDSVFSMDGDLANLLLLSKTCQQNKTNLVVDDAHGIGWLGPQGRGAIAEAKLSQAHVPVLIGTFGKSFGGAGAFVAGSEIVINSLIQSSRSYIYSTAMPPAQAYAMQCAVGLIEQENWRREKLKELVDYFREQAIENGINLNPAATGPIQPVVIGLNEKTLKVSKQLLQNGFYVSAIRPPTVPEGQSRLRITLTSLHEKDQIDGLVKALVACLK